MIQRKIGRRRKTVPAPASTYWGIVDPSFDDDDGFTGHLSMQAAKTGKIEPGIGGDNPFQQEPMLQFMQFDRRNRGPHRATDEAVY